MFEDACVLTEGNDRGVETTVVSVVPSPAGSSWLHKPNKIRQRFGECARFARDHNAEERSGGFCCRVQPRSVSLKNAPKMHSPTARQVHVHASCSGSETTPR